jgi:hypothetical protein
MQSAVVGEGESTAGFTFSPCAGSFACPGTNTKVCTRNLSFTPHSKDEAIEVK